MAGIYQRIDSACPDPVRYVKRHLVLLYWLLLLVSTLAIGGVAFYTLQRESNRLRKIASDQSVQTGESIAASLSANVNRAITQTADSLSALSEDNLEAQLLIWKGNNLLASNVVMFKPAMAWCCPCPTTVNAMIWNPFCTMAQRGFGVIRTNERCSRPCQSFFRSPLLTLPVRRRA